MEGQALDTVYVFSDVQIVSWLWAGMGKELSGMLKRSNNLGRKAWTEHGGDVLTMQDLDSNVDER